MSASWTLTGPDGAPYQSDRPGTLGGHRRSKLYGRLDCRSALQALARGGYARDRVFFLDEHAAQAARYRPCAVCLPDQYAGWKTARPVQGRPRQTICPTVPERSRVLSISPRTLPPRPDFPEDEGAPTEPELRTVIAQLERLGARLVSVGHGRDRRSRLAAEHFAAVWNASTDRNGLDRSVAVIVDWATDAASWLKPARRLTEAGVDARVISDTPHTWAQMSRRLRDSTNWDPGRTIALAALDTPLTIALAGANTLDGLRGASSDGRLWFVHDGRLIQHTPTQQKGLMNSLLPRTAVEIAPGAVHVPDWLTIEQQRALVTACRGWAAGPAPMRHTRLPNGSTMSVQTVCLGWHWTPYKYTRAAVDQNDAPVTPFPNWLGELSRQALADAYGSGPSVDTYKPDAALINFYDRHAKLGMHQDKDERTDAPVVSLSIGATCIFRFGNTEDRNAPYTDIDLRSGDLFVFGGPSRLAYHGVPRTIQAGTTNPDTGLTDARLNITVRNTGLSHAPPRQAAPIPAAD